MQTNLLTRRGILAGTASAGLLAVASCEPAVAMVAAHPDAELIRRADLMRAHIVAERQFYASLPDDEDPPSEDETAIFASAHEIVNPMLITPAITLEGLKAKAVALEWLWTGEDPASCFGQATTDKRIVASILRDLLTMVRAPA